MRPTSVSGGTPAPVLTRVLVLVASALQLVGGVACTSKAPAGTEALTMQVMGSDIVVPVPPGMRRWKVERDGFKHSFEPTVRRQQKPYYAIASIRGANERAANDVYQEVRAARLGPTEGEPLIQWREALVLRVAGEQGSLPDAPEGFLMLERDTASAGTIIDVVHLREGDNRSFLGSATMLVNARALALDIILKQPVDRAEIAAVRGQIHKWAQAVRAANP